MEPLEYKHHMLKTINYFTSAILESNMNFNKYEFVDMIKTIHNFSELGMKDCNILRMEVEDENYS